MKKIIQWILELFGIRVKTDYEKELEKHEESLEADVKDMKKDLGKDVGDKTLEDELEYWDK